LYTIGVSHPAAQSARVFFGKSVDVKAVQAGALAVDFPDVSLCFPKGSALGSAIWWRKLLCHKRLPAKLAGKTPPPNFLKREAPLRLRHVGLFQTGNWRRQQRKRWRLAGSHVGLQVFLFVAFASLCSKIHLDGSPKARATPAHARRRSLVNLPAVVVLSGCSSVWRQSEAAEHSHA
jgi:hypothetical protein